MVLQVDVWPDPYLRGLISRTLGRHIAAAAALAGVERNSSTALGAE